MFLFTNEMWTPRIERSRFLQLPLIIIIISENHSLNSTGLNDNTHYITQPIMFVSCGIRIYFLIQYNNIQQSTHLPSASQNKIFSFHSFLIPHKKRRIISVFLSVSFRLSTSYQTRNFPSECRLILHILFSTIS